MTHRKCDPLINVGLLAFFFFIMFIVSEIVRADDTPDPQVWTRNDGKQIEVPYGKRIVLVPWWWTTEDICWKTDGAMNPQVITGPEPQGNDCPDGLVVSPNVCDPN